MSRNVAAELEQRFREADVLVGRQIEARLDLDRAYDRMLAEQDDARARYKELGEALRAVTDDIAILRGLTDEG